MHGRTVRVYTFKEIPRYNFATKKNKTMQANIPIDKSKLLTRVRLTLAYNADRNPAMQERYAEAVMTNDDDAIVTNRWESALEWVAIALQRYGGDVLNGHAGISLLQLSPNSLAAKTGVLERAIASAVEAKITSEWLSVIGDVDNYEKYRLKAQGYIEEVTDLCNRRVRPT